MSLWKDNPYVKTFTIPAQSCHACGDIVSTRIAVGPAQTAIWDAALSRDGRVLASASLDGRLYLWRRNRDNTWPPQPELQRNTYALRVSWSPDGQLAFTSANVLTVCDWSPRIICHSNRSQQPLPDGTGFYHPLGNGIFTVVWSPDGKEIATGDGKSDVTIWDARTRSILAQHSSCGTAWVSTVAWNPVNSRSLAVGCYNKGSAHLLQWNPDKKALAWIYTDRN